MDASLIDQFEQGGAKVRAAIVGLSREDLLARPVPGMWSIQEVIIHLQDSDAVVIDRMRRIIAENNPLLMAFDETKFAKNLHYDVQSAEDAAELIEIGRRQFCRVLRRLNAEKWQRTGIHNERGKLTLEDCLTYFIEHIDHHLKFVDQKREKLGKPRY